MRLVGLERLPSELSTVEPAVEATALPTVEDPRLTAESARLATESATVEWIWLRATETAAYSLAETALSHAAWHSQDSTLATGAAVALLLPAETGHWLTTEAARLTAVKYPLLTAAEAALLTTEASLLTTKAALLTGEAALLTGEAALLATETTRLAAETSRLTREAAGLAAEGIA